MNNMQPVDCKEPFISSNNPKILILGTLPGNESVDPEFYYASNRNAFWEILAKVFDEEKPASIEDKKALLKKYDISLWDVYKHGVRPKNSSSDNETTNKIPNDEILDKFDPETIICNGQEAFDVFVKQYPKYDQARIKQLLSSSKRHGKWPKGFVNLNGWEVIREFCK